jgi:DNA-binding winged helix-turn-helix (wHTH) protein/TolB-like protein
MFESVATGKPMMAERHFQFGAFQLFPAEHLLLRDGKAIALTPKAFDVLAVLVQSGGHLVTREALMKAVWRDSFVEESNLTVNVSGLRKILGEPPSGEPYIVTVPTKGYRFNAGVTAICEAALPVQPLEMAGLPPAVTPLPAHVSLPKHASTALSDRTATPSLPADGGVAPAPASGAAALESGFASAPPDALPASPPVSIPASAPAVAPIPAAGTSAAPGTQAARFHHSLPRIALLVTAILFIAFGAGFGYIELSRQHRQATVTAATRSIAVLPLEVLSPDAGDDYLGLGMSDALITRLGSLHQVVVRPVGAVRKYVTDTDPIAAGRKLAVEAVLEGTIQRIGDHTRVTVRLLRVADGELLWSDTFDGRYSDAFTLEDSISQRLADALTLKLSSDEQARLATPHTQNAEAYQLCLKGRYFWNKRTVDSVEKSLDYFQQAIKADPRYVSAYAGLADAYILAGSYGISFMPPETAMPLAKGAAEKALHLDDSSAEAHTSLAYIHLTYDWDWASAEREFERALSLNPGYDTAHHWYSHELSALGRHQESIDEARRALELSPTDTVMNEHLGWSFLMGRRYPQAVDAVKRAIELDPNFVQAHRVLGLAYQYEGRNDDAIAEFEKGVTISHNDPVAQLYLARSYAIAGRSDDARRLLGNVVALSRTRYVSAAEIAAVYSCLDDHDNAFRWIDTALAQRASALIYIQVDRGFDNLRSDPRYEHVLQSMKLK